MPTLVEQCTEHLGRFVRSGGKVHREVEAAKIVSFLVWVQANDNVLRIDRLGKKQVIGFWRAHRHLSERTTYDYWLAISKLWVWIEKSDEPPRPYSPSELAAKREGWKNPQHAKPESYTDFRLAISAAMTANCLGVDKLATITGVEKGDLETMLSDLDSGRFQHLEQVMVALGMVFSTNP